MKRIGIDVGGTFTDVVAMDETTGAVTCFKVPTDYDQPADGIMRAYDAAQVDGAAVNAVKLGTTLGLNAVLTRRGARTGLITTAGFRDVLEIRRTHRDRLFDLDETIPPPLVPRHLRLEAVERVGAGGEVVTPLDEDSVRRAWRELRAQGVTSVAIAFLFSFKNPAHERRARDVVQAEGGAESIFISSDVLPVHREYERTSTTVTAAYVAPVVRDYVTELGARLSGRGLPEHRLSVMTNSGGSMSAGSAASAPVPTLLSGPAGGVTGARRLARETGFTDLLTLDMGGTSCDVSGIQAGKPDERLDMRLAGLDVAHPSFDIHTIGAGGGSIAWIDSGGALRIGPASAGSTPGPACYGRGGTEPTVTDANLVLGRYEAAAALGGLLTLDSEAARRAVEERIAVPLGLSVEHAAAGILRVVNANMVNAVRSISVERGRDPRGFALVAFGGGGPVHAPEIARELGIGTVIVPPFPGCTSAFGAAMALARRDALRSVNAELGRIGAADLAPVVADLVDEVGKALSAEGVDTGDGDLELWLHLHYRGQAHDLTIRHRGLEVSDASLRAAGADFAAEHARHYGHAFDDVPIELATVRVTGHERRDDPEISWHWAPATGGAGETERPVYFEDADAFADARVWDRSAIGTGHRIAGPAVVHQADATVLVPPGWDAVAQASGILLLSDSRAR
ncbi:hydantoinase/oxoprolinase family protein [Actinomadura sp. B10D3]|uniref:hydantoinase/oxoprolinase family protein n=1 Tax=Actinomadura sp. B10D3 TaxID=3153557 RepID=UPI00325F6151